MTNNRAKLLGGVPIIPEVCKEPGESGLVSVLIPTYNRRYILEVAIESVLSQTYPSIEIIVVDDGSTDDTCSFMKKYPQVLYIYQENAGLAAARNTGLAAARGEFLAFLDSDDSWLPWKVEAQVALMQRNRSLSLVWTDMIAVNPSGQILHSSYIRKGYQAYQHINIDESMPISGTIESLLPNCPPEAVGATFRCGDISELMLMGNLVHPPSVLLRRELVALTGGLDIAFSWTCEDYEFFWRLAQQGPGGFIDAPAMRYVIDSEDKLTSPGLLVYLARGNLIAMQRFVDQNRKRLNLPSELIRRQLAGAHAWVGEEELQSPNGERKYAIFHLIQSLLRNPFQKKLLMLLPFSVLPSSFLKLARWIKQKSFAMLNPD